MNVDQLADRRLSARALLATLRPVLVLSVDNPALRQGLAPRVREAATVVSDELERLGLDGVADMDDFDDLFFGSDESSDLELFDAFVSDLMKAEVVLDDPLGSESAS